MNVTRWLAAPVASLLLAGCSAQQQATLAADEAYVNAELVKLEAGLTWAQGHEAEISAGLDKVAALDPGNKTLQTAAAKGKALVASGAIDRAHGVVAGAILVTAPVAGVSVTTAADLPTK